MAVNVVKLHVNRLDSTTSKKLPRIPKVFHPRFGARVMERWNGMEPTLGRTNKRQASGSAKTQPEVNYANASVKAGLRGRKINSPTEATLR